MLNYKILPIGIEIPEVKYKAVVYETVRLETNILPPSCFTRVSYYKHSSPRPEQTEAMIGSQVLLVDRTKGES